MRIIRQLFLAIIFFMLIFYGWRYASKSRHIPCPSWLSWFVELENPLTSYTRADTLIEQTDIKSGMDLIDLGCGPGRLTIALAKKLGNKERVTAFDVQDKILEKLERKA